MADKGDRMLTDAHRAKTQTLVGVRLREQMNLADFNPSTLSTEAEVSRATVYEVLHGNGNVQMGTIFALAHALGCEARALIPTVREVTE